MTGFGAGTQTLSLSSPSRSSLLSDVRWRVWWGWQVRTMGVGAGAIAGGAVTAGMAASVQRGWGRCDCRWCCDCWHGCERATGVTAVLSSLLTALSIALFTCVVSRWTWCGGLTLHMHVVCVLSSSLPSHPLTLVRTSLVILFTFVFRPMLVCVMIVHDCCAGSRSSTCAE